MSIKDQFSEMCDALDMDDSELDRLEEEQTEITLPVIKKRRSEIKKKIYDAGGDLDEDYQVARETLHDLMDMGNYALQRLIALTEVYIHPRTFEVAAGMIKSMSDLSKDLIELHQKMKKLKEAEMEEAAKSDDKSEMKEINPADLL